MKEPGGFGGWAGNGSMDNSAASNTQGLWFDPSLEQQKTSITPLAVVPVTRPVPMESMDVS